MKRIIIRLTGAAAALASVKTAELALKDEATYAEVIETLGRTFPCLVGLVIDQDGKTMLSSNMFLVNGQDYVMVGMWNQTPKDGDSLLLVSPLTGG